MAEQSAEIRVVKRRKGHAGHHGGAWKVAYADFVTAMMAFFLVMWIIGLSPNVKQAVAAYFQDPEGFMAAVNSGKAPFAVNNSAGGLHPKSQQLNGGAIQERAKLQQVKKSIERLVMATPEFKDLGKYIDIKLVDEGLRIDLLEAKESLFFDSGSAKVKPATRKLLADIASELTRLSNRVIIEGHTDSRPLNRADGYTNWELSADRANSARRIMENAGLPDSQLAQVRGYAATQPRDPAHPTHFSNRRISILVVMSEAMKQQQFSQEAPDPNGIGDGLPVTHTRAAGVGMTSGR